MANHNELGKEGEKLAVNFLLEQGYEILECNYRFEKTEVDIITRIDQTLAIIEVKTRTTDYFGNPQDFVKPKQIQRIVKAIDHYVNSNALDLEVRFDIISIIKSKNNYEIDHLKHAFYPF